MVVKPKCSECDKTEWPPGSGKPIARLLVPFEGRDVCPNCYRELTHTEEDCLGNCPRHKSKTKKVIFREIEGIKPSDVPGKRR
jgi:hypothetical protein